jgi:excinuclease ABC subunit B
MAFELDDHLSPKGDQAQAIEKLVQSLQAGNRHQTLLGVTGSGKTFTAANVIAQLDRPTLVMSHNKTLAAQLYSEFKQFFPHNAVEYFVSYFDYYQPEAYIPRSDTYIEKDSSINEEIERLRLSTTTSLLTRPDVIVVASVSCIYGLGSPEDYREMLLSLSVGQSITREQFLSRLVDMLYERNDITFGRGRFRVRGDVVEVQPGNLDEQAYRIEFFGDEIERISLIDPLTGNVEKTVAGVGLFPAKQFVTPADKLRIALGTIREELDERVAWFEKEGKLLEAQRIKLRTDYDLEMLQEMGFCSGIENYTRHLTGRPAGSRPNTLLDFFPEDFLTIIDESHATVPQVGGMYEGDRSRKQVLVDYGFRLPSAMDNRPLRFEEFMGMTGQLVYVSATPADFEIKNSVVGNQTFVAHKRAALGKIGEAEIIPAMLAGLPNDRLLKVGDAEFVPPAKLKMVRRGESAASDADDPRLSKLDVTTPGAPLIVEQIIRPTGLLDPLVRIRPLKGQIDETIELCRQRVERKERVLVTTLTKRTAEDLTDYLRDVGLKVRYLHSDIDAIERVEILRSLRAAEFDILVGINLLREGLDLPEVSLVCILDADKEGYLRSQTSLIQTAGRAARHINGEVFLFADTITGSMQRLIDVSDYRRSKQEEYNRANGITPRSVQRAVQESLHMILRAREIESSVIREAGGDFSVTELIRELEGEMAAAASALEYERAAMLRDQIFELKKGAGLAGAEAAPRPVKYGRPKGRRR